jgi:hypothetical protein
MIHAARCRVQLDYGCVWEGNSFREALVPKKGVMTTFG